MQSIASESLLLKCILNAEYCQGKKKKKRGSQNPRIYSDFIVWAPRYPCTICKSAMSLSFFPLFSSQCHQESLEIKKKKVGSAALGSPYHLIKLARVYETVTTRWTGYRPGSRFLSVLECSTTTRVSLRVAASSRASG